MDHTTGKCIKTGKADMSRMQDLAAECLEMDRGRSKEETGKDHLERNDFVISKQRAKIEEQKAESYHLNKGNNAKTSRLNELDAQIAEKEEELAQERRGGLDAILSGTANMFGKGKYAAIEKRNKVIDAIIDYAHSAFGGNGKHGDIFPNDEVVAIKTIIDQYAENKEARISVGNWQIRSSSRQRRSRYFNVVIAGMKI